MNTVYLNGEYLDKSEAKISPFDRGFLFGDGVYEVIPVYAGKAFLFKQHFERLERSLQAIDMKNPLSEKECRAIAKNLLLCNGETQLFYIQITRGAASTRKHTYDAALKPTIFAFSLAFIPVATSGVAAITQADERWSNCYIKSLNLLPNILAAQQAANASAVEAILVREGYVTEGSSSNVFIVKDSTIFTPPLQTGMLKGTTRELVLQLAKHKGLNYHEAPISESMLKTADEIWLTSVGKEITPVTQLNGNSIGSGEPGPLWKTLYDAYQVVKTHDCEAL